MDRRQDEPRQSSLPSSLHPHLVTRPRSQAHHSEGNTSSRGGSVVHGESGVERSHADLELRLPPITPTRSPVIFDDTGQRSSAIHSRRETILRGAGDPQDESYGRVFLPLPRHRETSSVHHGLPLPSSRSGAIFDTYYPYTAHASQHDEGVPRDYNFSGRDRSRSPPWRDVEAGPSSQGLPGVGQIYQGGRNDRGSLSLLLNPEHRQGSPLMAPYTGEREVRWMQSRTGYPIYPSDAQGFGSDPYRAMGSNIDPTPDFRSPQPRDIQRHHSPPSERAVGRPPPAGSGSINPLLLHGHGGFRITSVEPSTPIKEEVEETDNSLRVKGKKRKGNNIFNTNGGKPYSRNEGSSKRSRDPDARDVASQTLRRKKATVACKFCKGRKLRCSGERPKCSNCGQREGQECIYAAAPKRRGPGKANKSKGSKGTKGEQATTPASGSQSQNSGSLPGGHFPPVAGSFDRDPFALYRQSATSLASLDTKSIMSAATPPPHTPSTADEMTRPASPIDGRRFTLPVVQGSTSRLGQSVKRQHSDEIALQAKDEDDDDDEFID